MNKDISRAIDIRLRRHKEGVRVFVRVSPEVEEFFKRWGGGVVEAPSGRFWAPSGTEKLQVWSFDPSRDFAEQSYSLVHTGRMLWVDDGIVNLSFIRLVGASEGIKFTCDALMSRPELDRISLKLSKAAQQFYTDFIQPVDVNIFVGVRDMLHTEL